MIIVGIKVRVKIELCKLNLVIKNVVIIIIVV